MKYLAGLGRVGLLSACILLAGTIVSRADLLVLDGSEFIRRYSETNGAQLGIFAQSPPEIEGFDGLAFGPDGNLYVTGDSLGYGEVVRFNGTTGAFIDTFIPLNSGGLSAPAGMTFEPDGLLYIASYSITNFSPYPGTILRYATNGAFVDSYVPTDTGRLQSPYDLAFGPNGRLYISDGLFSGFGGQGVLRYDSGLSPAILVPAGPGGLTNASGMAFGPDGAIYVSSYGGNSVLRFDATNGTLLGQFVATGAGGLSGPAGLAFGPDGNLYVCSRNAHAVIRYNGRTGSFIDTFVPPGSGGLTSGPYFIAFTPARIQLKIARAGTGVMLSWPVTGSNYMLETRSPAAGSAWQPVTLQPTQVGDQWTVTNTAPPGSAWYRLHKQ